MPSNQAGTWKPNGRLKHEVSGQKGRKTETDRQTDRQTERLEPRICQAVYDMPQKGHELSWDGSLCRKLSGRGGLAVKLMELHSQAHPPPRGPERGLSSGFTWPHVL